MLTEKAFKSGSEFPPYSPGTIRLYSMRWCPFAQRARIVLEHKNIKYEVVNIDLSDKPEWFIKDINPLGKVPALQIDDQIVYESGLVSDYLDEIYPYNKLTPSDPYQRAKDSMFMEFYSKAVGAFYKLYFNKDPSLLPEIGQAIRDSIQPLEKELETRGTPYFGGEEPSMLDFMMWPHMERINAMNQIVPVLQLDKTKLVRFIAWIERMLTVRAIKATALPVEFYKKMMQMKETGKVDYDLGLEE